MLTFLDCYMKRTIRIVTAASWAEDPTVCGIVQKTFDGDLPWSKDDILAFVIGRFGVEVLFTDALREGELVSLGHVAFIPLTSLLLKQCPPFFPPVPERLRRMGIHCHISYVDVMV